MTGTQATDQLAGAVPGALIDRVRMSLAATGADPSPSHVAAALRAQGRVLGDAGVLAVVDALRRDSVGAGPLDPLLRSPGVTDVLVNGAHQVYVERGGGLERTEVSFPDDAAVRRLAQRLASAGGRRLDDATPFVDVRLADGTRFNAVLSPLASPGTCLSLRVPARRAFALAELVDAGTLSPAAATLLSDIVRSRLAFVVSGGTGSGKTTLLTALLSIVAPDERIVVVEDARELRLEHSHVVALEARPPNIEGAGKITLQDLVRQALRMRPDRLVVGEVRGAEVVDLLTALNTGHDGGCGTLHANAAEDVPARLEALALSAGLPRAALHAQLFSALQVAIHLVRANDGVRRVSAVCTFVRRGSGLVDAVPAVRFDADGVTEKGPGAPELKRMLSGAKR